jgi:O-methyltransferase involved in polyketide biosynthesis
MGKKYYDVEADHPASQAEKIAVLNEAQISIPENVSFVSIDLEKDDLAIVFTNSLLNLEEPIFISCLGVLVYLSKTCVDKIFSFTGQLAPNSEFVFTISHQRDTERLTITAENAAAAGEPWITHFNLDELPEQLQGFGFNQVIYEPIETIITRYFEGSKLQLPAPKRNTLVRALL